MLFLILLQLLQLQLKKHEEEAAALVVFFKTVPVPGVPGLGQWDR